MSTHRPPHSPNLPPELKPESSLGTFEALPPKPLTPPFGLSPVPEAERSNSTSTGILKADTNMSWGPPAGLKIRGPNDENLVIFRKALGINYHLESADECTLEEGRQSAVGIYKNVITIRNRKRMRYSGVGAFIYTCYFTQIVVGAALTALGASPDQAKWIITVLGALNTVLAGVLAMIKGLGQPQKLGRDHMEYRRLQDWIEETEALLVVGIIGRNRREVGSLVESAFKRYNAAKASEENNQADIYVNSPWESLGHRESGHRDLDDLDMHRNGKIMSNN